MDLGTFHPHRRFRALAVAGVLSLAVTGLAACGDDDDKGQDRGDAPSETEPAHRSEDRGDSRGRSGARPASGPSLDGDVEQAREAVADVDRVYERFDAAVEEGVAAVDVPVQGTLEAAERIGGLTDVCDLMSDEAKRQAIVYAERSAGLAGVDWTCEKATGLLLRRTRQSGGLKRSLDVEIVGVNAEGARATASVRFGGKGPISTLPLVKEDGEWKLAASPTGP